jgi:flagella basal body P-ring formation protein FlgA
MPVLPALFAAPYGAACFEVVRALLSGTPLAAEDVRQVPCDAARTAAAVRYDASAGTAVALSPLSAGDYLGRLAEVPAKGVAKGARLTLRSSAGPVIIEREVTAIQAGRAGQRIFVQDAGGKIFAAPLVVGAEGGE